MTRTPTPIRGARSLKTAASCCRSCGRPLVPAVGLQLSPIQKRIMTLIERHGEIHPDVLWHAIYGSDPNGGPEPKTIDVHIHQMNKRLRNFGLAIQRRIPKKQEQPWHLVALEAAE